MLYHPGSRGIEYDLPPWMREHDVALMAYCPLAQAGTLRRGLFSSPELAEVARRHGASVPQVILAWDIRDGRTIAIPKSSTPEHAAENAAAARIELDDDDLAFISRAWSAPSHKVPLDVQQPRRPRGQGGCNDPAKPGRCANPSLSRGSSDALARPCARARQPRARARRFALPSGPPRRPNPTERPSQGPSDAKLFRYLDIYRSLKVEARLGLNRQAVYLQL